MSAYVIFDATITDEDVAKSSTLKAYSKKAFESATTHGGKLVAKTENIDIREGDWSFDRVLIIQFPSMKAAQAWYDSPEYQEILPIRLNITNDQMMIVEGL